MAPSKDNKTRSDKPTLRTISEISGLAVATVSRALNDAPDLSVETKKMVRRIATEIGYVPNRAGLGLRTGKTNVISLVLSTENDMLNYTAQLMSSIAGGLRGTPYHLTITPYFADQDLLEPVRYVVETGSADAMILNQTRQSDPRIDYLLEKGFPFATHGRTAIGQDYAHFDYDNEQFARIAVRKLHRRGSRNALVIAPPREQAYAQHMCEGAMSEAKALGMKLRIEEAVHSDMVSRDVQTCVERRLTEEPEIDGYIAASALSSMAAIGGLEAVGRQLGHDINVATKEPVGFMKLFREEIIVLNEDISQAGSFLAKAILERLRQPERTPLQCLEVPKDDGL